MNVLPTGLENDQREAAEKFAGRLLKIYIDCLYNGGPSAEFVALEKGDIDWANAETAAKLISEGKSPL